MAQKRSGWSKQAILAAFAAFPPLKMVTVVDDDVDLRSAQDVEWAMATRLDPKSGIVTIDRAFGHGLNPSFPDYLGPKVGFDCTRPCPPSPDYERATYKEMSLGHLAIVDRDIVRPAVEDDGPAPAAVTEGMPLTTDRNVKKPKPPAPKAAKSAKKKKKKLEDWVARLADPAPADFTVPKARPDGGRQKPADEDPDDWIGRPAPADFTVPKARTERSPAKAASPPAAAAKPAAVEPAPSAGPTAPVKAKAPAKPAARKKPTPGKGGGGFFQGGGM
jgi:3-polyprenyl-4-hydroxybenzoate decarboxylase